MSWQTPITDRTQTDVDYARAHPDVTEDLKGAYNVSDHARVENNISVVHDQMALVATPPTMTYSSPTAATLGWATIINTLVNNIQALRNTLFPSLSTVPGYVELSANVSPNYSTVNAYEADLAILREYIQGQYDTAPFLDTFYCGGTYL